MIRDYQIFDLNTMMLHHSVDWVESYRTEGWRLIQTATSPLYGSIYVAKFIWQCNSLHYSQDHLAQVEQT